MIFFLYYPKCFNCYIIFLERGTNRERMDEFEEAVTALDVYMASIQKVVEERTRVVTLLEQAEIFYETQRGEAKLVANVSQCFFSNNVTLLSRYSNLVINSC